MHSYYYCLLTLGTFLSLVLRPTPALGHAKWICPTPRSDSAGLKVGACGDVGSISDTQRTSLSPGPLTVYFQETIVHRGAPFRISLSRPGVDDYEACVLLDHIPHNDNAGFGQFYGITINIPDFNCPNCALQLIQFMTDKVAGQCTFNPADTNSFNNGQCGSNYFSCANVAINGTQSFDGASCTRPAEYAQSYHYLSNEATEWTAGGYIKSYGPNATRIPVYGLCSSAQDPTAFDSNGQFVGDGALPSGIKNVPVIAGVVGTLVILMIGGLAFFLYRRRLARKREEVQGLALSPASPEPLKPQKLSV